MTIDGTNGDGLFIVGEAGHGVIVEAAGASKHGLFVTGGTSGTSDGIKAVAGTGGVDIRGNITGNLTGNISGDLQGTLTATERNAICDAALVRDWTSVGAAAARSTFNALRFLRNKWSIAGGTLTVTKEDDTTSAWTGAVTTAASNPVDSIDPT
jgi:hypothetical protein